MSEKKSRCIWYSVCPIKRFTEEGKLEDTWVKSYCLGDNSNCVRKKMEDDGIYHPDNMLPDGTIRKDLK